MAFFLHEQGYNFFNIGKLTYGELNALVETNNRRVEEQKREIERSKSKRKR